MEPTEEQAEALGRMSTFLSERKHPFFTLKGYAGTGKSYSITLLAKSCGLRPDQICFTAPTNKAVKVLRNYLDNAELAEAPTKTIYSLLGLSLQPNGEVKEIAKPEEPVDLSRFKVIVVDEGSMVNKFLMSAIREAQIQWNIPFIFMGDPAQLPPVNEIASPIWDIEESYLLTKVMRYGDAMLDLATSIRKVVDNPFPSVKIETSPPVYRYRTKGEWLGKVEENLELFKSGEAKIIAWRNVTVNAHNTFIRNLIYGKVEAQANPWLAGDKIVARAPLKNLDDAIIMQNAEEATILEVAIGQHPLHTEFEIYNLLVEHETGRKLTLRSLTSSGQFHVNNRLEELATEARGGKRYKWREFWQLKEAFHDIRHAYAWTSHMSQGSSVLKVFVDLEDILLNRNRPEAFRSLYVACTRQREELHIV